MNFVDYTLKDKKYPRRLKKKYKENLILILSYSYSLIIKKVHEST